MQRSEIKDAKQNSKIVFVAGIIILIFAILGYFKAVPSPTSDQGGLQGSQIVVEPKEFDFGDVEFGKVVEHTFEVGNIGDGTLEVNRVSTSCGCTKAEINEKKVEPDETADLLVTYDSGAMGKTVIGKRIERFIYIRSDDLENPQVEVKIYARVK